MTTNNQSLPPLPRPDGKFGFTATLIDAYSLSTLREYGASRAAYARRVAVEELADALCADCENGGKSMNVRALEAFRRVYPNLNNAIKELK